MNDLEKREAATKAWARRIAALAPNPAFLMHPDELLKLAVRVEEELAEFASSVRRETLEEAAKVAERFQLGTTRETAQRDLAIAAKIRGLSK